MIRKLPFLLSLLIIFTAANYFNEAIEGTWIGTYAERGSSVELTFNFTVDGDSLTGTLQNNDETMEISNGVIDGDSFSFDAVFGPISIPHEGVLNEDGTITITITQDEVVHEMKLVKQEEE